MIFTSILMVEFLVQEILIESVNLVNFVCKDFWMNWDQIYDPDLLVVEF